VIAASASTSWKNPIIVAASPLCFNSACSDTCVPHLTFQLRLNMNNAVLISFTTITEGKVFKMQLQKPL
jgi:hypothetical protein